MEGSERQHLPEAGGWWDQDEQLMEDIATLTQMAIYVHAQHEANESLGDA